MMLGFDVEAKELSLLQNRFMEASAGTGKTHTMVTLIVRLIIEEGLRLDQILVVTFTRLATFELKERIRKTLVSLLHKIEAGEALPDYLEGHSAKKLLFTLRGALSLVECAKIMTIHGFSAYLLSQYKNSSISEERLSGATKIEEIIKDFFRSELSQEEVALWQQELLLNHYRGNFEKLVQEIGSFAVRRIPIQSGPSYQERLSSLQKKCARVEKRDLIKETVHYKGLFTREGTLKESALQEFTKFAEVLAGKESNLAFKELFKLLPKNKKVSAKDVKPLYTEIIQELQEVNDPLIIFATLAERARRYFGRVVDADQLLFYDDLLLGAAELVTKKAVQKGISEECKVALIDEFQDTDALQWKIFSTLFLERDALIVVGDPKQSIYRFRQADLYTYMRAKKSFVEQCSLTTNYRSKPKLVEGLNALFAPVEEFLVLPETKESYPCPPVEAASGEGGALTIWEVDSEEQLFALVVQELYKLQKEISLSECAILVKDRHQMKRFKGYCTEHNLPLLAVNEEPITASLGFSILQELIEALLAPYDLSKSGKLLLSPLFGYSIEEVESAQLELLPTLVEGSHLLQERGLLVAVEGVVGNLLSSDKGMRIYSDMMQLVELAEESFVRPSQLLPFFQALRCSKERQEELMPRPLTNEGAPTVMTIHMSKGLEFEVLFPIGIITPFHSKRELVYSSAKKCYCVGELQQELAAEKMRLLYVALTRAKSRLYLPYIGGTRKMDVQSSCIDYFRSKNAFALTHSFMGQKITAPLFPKQEDVSCSPSPSPPQFHSARISSFSALYSHSGREKGGEPLFPTGSEVGTLMHTLLEKIPFTVDSIEELRRQITPYLTNTILSEFIAPVAKALYATLHIRFREGFGLADLDEEKMVKEVPFIFLQEEGGRRGVIDLFFAHKGRYYFIDWKSNYLEEYSRQAMEEEMEACHYYEQAKIYKEALKRYVELFDRRPFDEIFGGYYYIFMRGGSYIYGR